MTSSVDPSGLCCAPVAAKAPPPPALNLLLVSESTHWREAVQAAAAEIGGGVSNCDARDAVIRLAGITPHYSHLLLDPGSADGLLDELVTLTAGDRESSTAMLLLGSQVQQPPRTRRGPVTRSAGLR